MTDQEVFDKVVTALRGQHYKSYKNGICAYRGRKGRKCAAGHLIPDELYDEEMEGKIWSDVCIMSPVLDRLPEHIVAGLQQIHDDCHVSSWESRWWDLACRYGLKYTPPE